MRNEPQQAEYAFGPFHLDTGRRRLLRDGAAVPLQPKDFETLLVLVQHCARVVAKEELMALLWPDAIVEEANLSQHIYVLRKALGEGTQDHAYIVTVPGRGYRFVAPVTEWCEEAEELLLAQRTRTHLVIEETEERQGERETERRGEKLLVRSRGRVVVTGALLVGLVAVLVGWWMTLVQEPVRPAIRSIAVLPFKSLQATGGDEYLGLGIADTLITKLGGLRQLVVRPTSAMLKYNHPAQDPLAAGREQQVEAVLDASLQRNGDKVRVTVRLLNVSDETALWTYQCDEEYCADLFVMQDVISERVAAALASQLTGEEQQRLRKHYTENRAAYELYLQGRYFVNQGYASRVTKGIEFFQQAVATDPNFALAHAGLAEAYFHLARSGTVMSTEVMPKAKTAALRSLTLDEALAEAHLVAAQIKTYYDWDWAGAEQEYQRALHLNPSQAEAQHWYGRHLVALGRFAEAQAALNRARQLDPLSISISLSIGDAYYYARQYDPAIRQLEQTREMNPNYPYTRWALGRAYLQQAKYQEAIAVLQEELQRTRANPPLLATLGYTYAISGRRDEALKILTEMKALARTKYFSPMSMVLIYPGLGEPEQALDWLEKAYAERSHRLAFLKVDPLFDSLRANPRFAAQQQRIGLR
jgi:DNA-binding winged helix-turn-helix (wHTH) protein/TolB-like protein/thioredoxin-like negative regulator of GroEL